MTHISSDHLEKIHPEAYYKYIFHNAKYKSIVAFSHGQLGQQLALQEQKEDNLPALYNDKPSAIETIQSGDEYIRKQQARGCSHLDILAGMHSFDQIREIYDPADKESFQINTETQLTDLGIGFTRDNAYPDFTCLTTKNLEQKVSLGQLFHEDGNLMTITDLHQLLGQVSDDLKQQPVKTTHQHARIAIVP